MENPQKEDTLVDLGSLFKEESIEPQETPVEETPAKEAPTLEKEAPAPKEDSFKPEAISKAIEEGFRSAQASAKAPEQKPQLSSEEIAKIMKKSSYSVEDLQKLGWVNEETEAEIAERRVQELSSILSRPVEESKAYTELMSQALLQKVQKQIQPLIDYYNNTQQQQAEQEFYNKYSDLKGHEEIVDFVTQKLLKDGTLVEGKSTKEEVFNAVATHAQSLITKISPNNISATHKSEAISEVPKPATSTDTSRRSQETVKTGQENKKVNAILDLFNET